MVKRILVLGLLLASCTVALTQDIPNHSVPIGGGPGAVGWRFATPGPAGGCLISGGATVDPTFVPCGAGLLVGGANGQIQYNSMGFLGGFTMGGDSTVNTTTGAMTLATVNSMPGTYGSSTQCPTITVNGKGLITAASQIACAGGPGGTSGQVQYNNSGALGGFTMGGDATVNTGTGALTLANVNSGVGTWGSATQCPVITVNAKGLITAASQVGCTGPIATNNDVWSGAAGKLIDAAVAQSSIAPVTIGIIGATFTPNFGSGGSINEEITLVHASCPCTIANPTAAYAGLNGFITLIQSATGSDVINTWGSTWKFAGGIKPVLSTTANAVDTFGFYCRSPTFCEVSAVGFAFQ